VDALDGAPLAAQAACPEGRRTVAPAQLVLTPSNPTGQFRLTNCTAAARQFTVRKPDAAGQGLLAEEEPPASYDWLQLGLMGQAATHEPTLTVELEPEQSTLVSVDASEGAGGEPWSLVLAVTSVDGPSAAVRLAYEPSPQGQWAGKMYYLASFGTGDLDEWRAELSAADGRPAERISAVGNALVRRWWGYRSGQLSYDEFVAKLEATRTESWRLPASRAFCANDKAACYPSDNQLGFSVYTDDVESSPVPSGVSGNIVLNLGGADGQPMRWEGRVESRQSLQFPGQPTVAVEFAEDPTACHGAGDGSCLTPLKEFEARMVLGDRGAVPEQRSPLPSGWPSVPDQGSCPDGYVESRQPWLVPGFEPPGFVDDESGRGYTRECRLGLAPYPADPEQEDAGPDAASVALNASLSGANPVPGGPALVTVVHAVDGALIDGQELFLIFEQHLPSFLHAAPVKAYGFMHLRRTEATLSAEDLTPTPPAEQLPTLEGGPGSPTCADWMVQEILPGGLDTLSDSLTPSTADQMARLALGASPAVDSLLVSDPSAYEEVHYLCHMDGYFDGGPAGDRACPPGSKVTFFTISTRWDSGDLTVLNEPHQRWTEALPCNERWGQCRPDEPCAATEVNVNCALDANGQRGFACAESGGCTTDANETCRFKGDCEPVLDRWLWEWEGLGEQARAEHFFRPRPYWHCVDPEQATCDVDPTDLRVGKVFYAVSQDSGGQASLPQAIQAAFRYKRRFASRLSGASVGFAPRICQGDAYPYCYDPQAIEQIGDRATCLSYLYTHHYDKLDSAVRARAARFLKHSFAYEELPQPERPTPAVVHGFEPMYAELLVMLGDEAATSALAARFDLAEQMVASFEGSAFEHDGLDLAGGAGYELHSLHQATQYYQMALDRLHSLSEIVGRSLDPAFDGERVLGPEAAVSWLKRLIRASSLKARTWAEISRRYHALGRPAPARRIAEKAYVTAYLESIYLAQLMQRVLDRETGPARAQVEFELRQAQLTFKEALLGMSRVHSEVSDKVNYFGFAETYLPFPPLDPGVPNAFERQLERAQDKLAIAADKEAVALQDSRAYETDAAAFQNELASIDLELDGELGEVCGTFRATAPDGSELVYPAVQEYPHLATDRAWAGVDPCGLVGNGAIDEALRDLELARHAIVSWQQREPPPCRRPETRSLEWRGSVSASTTSPTT